MRSECVEYCIGSFVSGFWVIFTLLIWKYAWNTDCIPFTQIAEFCGTLAAYYFAQPFISNAVRDSDARKVRMCVESKLIRIRLVQYHRRENLNRSGRTMCCADCAQIRTIVAFNCARPTLPNSMTLTIRTTTNPLTHSKKISQNKIIVALIKDSTWKESQLRYFQPPNKLIHTAYDWHLYGIRLLLLSSQYNPYA